MRITLKDVRIEKEKTYFFLSTADSGNLEYCLKRDGITDFEFAKRSQYKSVLPASITVPTLHINPDDPDSPICHLHCVFISHMNTDDLSAKISQIHNLMDDDLRKLHFRIIKKPNKSST